MKFISTFFVCLLFAGSMYAQALRLPPGVQKVTAVEGITEYSLPNGLRVLLFPDASKQIITVNITYKVGSRHEGYGETGMAHLLEHMVFKGTPGHPNIPQELSEHGARPNGTTSFDRTNYYETFDATDENLRWALDLESDRMVNSYVARKDLESEFSVVRNEYERGENSPGGVLYKRMLGTVFQWHNYGHSTIGEKSDIEGAPIERLQAFYHHYYQPDNAVLVIAGKIDEQITLNMVQEYFGKIPKPERKLITTYTSEPTQDGERSLTLRRTGDVQVMDCMYRIPAASHADYPALSVLMNLLSDEPSGRLYKAMVETQKVVSVGGGASGFAEAGVIIISADLRQNQSIDSARTALFGVIDGLKDNPPTQEDVDKAKTRILKSFEMFLKQSDRVGLRLSEYIGQGDWRLAFLYRDNIEKVTPEDVARVAMRYFRDDNRTMGYFVPTATPDRAEIPPVPDLDALLKDYKGREAVAVGEDFDPTPAIIESRTERGSLPNGMQYAFLPKENRGDGVNAVITLRFGDVKTLQNMSVVGNFTASMLDMGCQEYDRAQIGDRFDALKARVNIRGSESGVNVSIETDRQHLSETIQTVGKILLAPTFPEEEFNKMKTEYLAGLEQQQSDPQALAFRSFQRINSPYPKGDPRYVMTFEEERAAVEALTIKEVRDFYKRFYGASNATAAVVGDFDAKEIKATMQTAFGKWKSPSPYQRISDDYKPVTAQVQSIETPDKANAIYVAGYGFPMRNDDPDYPAITIGGYMLGGGFLNSRLATRIRQKDGLSYTVRGSFSASAQDNNGSFNAFMIYNPENLEKLEMAFQEEIERVAKEGFTAEELEAAKSGYLKSRKVNRSSDAAIAGTLNSYLSYGRDMQWDAKFEEGISTLTLEQVNAAMKQYLDYSRMIRVKAGDFKKAEKP
ncbi:MAG: insulinase family protein [Lewinellaceae bacterium]|nr:insulinase family protein [Lewinellaceae bacterium]